MLSHAFHYYHRNDVYLPLGVYICVYICVCVYACACSIALTRYESLIQANTHTKSLLSSSPFLFSIHTFLKCMTTLFSRPMPRRAIASHFAAGKGGENAIACAFSTPSGTVTRTLVGKVERWREHV